MANIKSAKKRILQSDKKRIRNKAVRTETRTEIKKLIKMLDTGNGGQEHIAQLKKIEKLVDKAAGKGVIHQNKAARLKSRLGKKINALTGTKSSSIDSESQVKA